MVVGQVASTGLPPGQRAVVGFPRFGAQGGHRPPPVPARPVVRLGGDVAQPAELSLEMLLDLPRREVDAALHCVAGWSALALRWSGVSFCDVYERIVRPAVRPGVTPSYLVFRGLDGYRSIVRLEDVLSDRVLLADRLDGRPLSGEHGAPLRLVSPDQYGFVSTKHLCGIDVHATEPPGRYHDHPRAQAVLRLVRPHPRARAWEEERHRYLPGRLARLVYRRLVPLPAEPLEGTGGEADAVVRAR